MNLALIPFPIWILIKRPPLTFWEQLIVISTALVLFFVAVYLIVMLLREK